MEEKTEAQRGAVTCLMSHSKEVQSWEWNSNLLSWSAGVMFKMLNCRYSRRRTHQNRDTSHSPAAGPGGSCRPRLPLQWRGGEEALLPSGKASHSHDLILTSPYW